MEIMIDLETLATSSNAVVLSIGAVAFDIPKNKIVDQFYCRISVEMQVKLGRDKDVNTINWWAKQSTEARNVFKEEEEHPLLGLKRFSAFCKKHTPIYVWGNGSSFDISIMETLFKDFGLREPWAYNRVMDLRTFKRFVSKDLEVLKKGTYHNALDDAINQAELVLKAFNQT